MNSLWQGALARSKDSVTHLLANVILWLSVIPEVALDLLNLLDPEMNQQIVALTGELFDLHTATRVGLMLGILTKMARDRKFVPFTKAEPHS